jgi:hypothetical protein
MNKAGLAVGMLVVTALPAYAVQQLSGREEIDFDRPEAWAMKYFASVSLMTGLGPPRPLRLGQLRVVAEAQWIPELDDAQRVVGFNGTKEEDLNKLPAIGRLRVTVGLPWRLSLTLSYLPPIPIAGVEPNLFSLAIGRPFALGLGFTLGAQIYGQVGSVEGSYICSGAEAQAGVNPQKNPYQCAENSHDHVDLDYVGGELSASYRIRWAHRLEPYVTIGASYMNLTLRVNARYAGVEDRTELATQGGTFWTTTGLLFPITRRFDIGAEMFYSPLTVRRPPDFHDRIEGLLNVRGFIAYRFF